eukprot:818119-Amphidinium_carterae.1
MSCPGNPMRHGCTTCMPFTPMGCLAVLWVVAEPYGLLPCFDWNKCASVLQIAKIRESTFV